VKARSGRADSPEDLSLEKRRLSRSGRQATGLASQQQNHHKSTSLRSKAISKQQVAMGEDQSPPPPNTFTTAIDVYQSTLDDALTIIDHIAARVTASTITGLGCGAAYATLKGFPVAKTSFSAALSCALISTSCFGMERVAYSVLKQTNAFANRMNLLSADGDDATTATDNERSIQSTQLDNIIQSASSPKLLYGSYALGGLLGGGVAGFLFQGKPFAGAIMLTPIMLMVGKMELSLEEYKSERLQQLLDENNAKK